MNRLSRLLLLVLVATLGTLAMHAQRQRNYIFVFDCTKSMTGYNGTPDVLAAAQDFLWRTIQPMSGETDVQVLLFQGEVMATYACKRSEIDRAAIDKQIGQLVQNVTNTNICDAWLKAETFINRNKENYIILMTDGEDNVRRPAAVAKVLQQFCGKYPNTHAYYVMLTANAMKGIEPVRDVIELCQQIDLVDVSKGIVIPTSLTPGQIHINTLQLPHRTRMSLSLMDRYKAHVECSDPHFKVRIEGGEIKDGLFDVVVEPAYGTNKELYEAIGTPTYETSFDVVIEDAGVRLLNPTVAVDVANYEERMLRIEALADGEAKMDGASWYDSFLFWGADADDTLTIDLRPVFNQQARQDNSQCVMQIADRDGRADMQLLLNGQPTDGTIRLTADMDEMVLGVIFNHNAAQGNRYLDIRTGNAERLDRVNDAQANEFQASIRTHYSVVWNPLKWILLFVAIAIVVLLIVWFAVIRPLNYPFIRTSRLIVTAPYYQSRRIRGMRMMVLTNKRVKQSALSRIFTGEVASEVNDVWPDPIECTHNRRGLHIRLAGKYTIEPFASVLTSGTQYTVTHCESGQQATLQVN